MLDTAKISWRTGLYGKKADYFLSEIFGIAQAGFLLNGEPIDFENVFSADGFLPAILLKAQSLIDVNFGKAEAGLPSAAVRGNMVSLPYFGYALAIDEKAMLGRRAILDSNKGDEKQSRVAGVLFLVDALLGEDKLTFGIGNTIELAGLHRDYVALLQQILPSTEYGINLFEKQGAS